MESIAASCRICSTTGSCKQAPLMVGFDHRYLHTAVIGRTAQTLVLELWPSTTPATDTSAGSTRVGLRVSMSLAGVDDFASLFSFLSLYEGVESCSFCSEDKESQ